MAERIIKPPEKQEAPWVEIYKDFYILQTTHGCLVKVEGNVTFIPDGSMYSFPDLRMV